MREAASERRSVEVGPESAALPGDPEAEAEPQERTLSEERGRHQEIGGTEGKPTSENPGQRNVTPIGANAEPSSAPGRLRADSVGSERNVDGLISSQETIERRGERADSGPPKMQTGNAERQPQRNDDPDEMRLREIHERVNHLHAMAAAGWMAQPDGVRALNEAAEKLGRVTEQLLSGPVIVIAH